MKKEKNIKEEILIKEKERTGLNNKMKKQSSFSINKILLCSLIFIISISFVLGLSYKQGEPLDLKIPTNETSCDITIQYPNTTNFINEQSMTIFTGYANYTVGNNYLNNLGVYEYFSNCGNGVFEVTPTGETITETQGYIILGQIAAMFLLILLGINFSKDRWKLKSFFYLMASGVSIVMFNSIRLISGSSITLNSMGLVGLIIGIIVFVTMISITLVYFTIDVIDSVKQKKARKWI